MKYMLILLMLAIFPLQANEETDIQRLRDEIHSLHESINELDSKVELLAFSMMEFYSGFLLEQPDEDLEFDCDANFICDCDD